MLPKVVRVSAWLYTRLFSYALKFGIIGLFGYAIDVGIFNALRLGLLGDGHFFQGPLGAKIASVAVSTLATWFGNRYWTFRRNRRKNYWLELGEFVAVAVVGMGISLVCLFVSHYVLGFSSLIADNVSTNVIGLIIATGFRFLLYRFWVYGEQRSDGLATRKALADVETATTAGL